MIGRIWLSILCTFIAAKSFGAAAAASLFHDEVPVAYSECAIPLEKAQGYSPEQLHQKIAEIKQALEARVIGQDKLIDALLIGLLTNGNILVEGPPGTAKTRTIKTLGELIDAKTTRFQFMADKMPSDITGSEIFDHETGHYQFRPGPIFTNLLLADEINRANSRTQSALLEAMEEHQVTISGHTHKLSDVFLVMATQNPFDQEGTYKLPEAQLDRFLLKVVVGYLTPEQEKQMLQLVRNEQINENSAQTNSPHFSLDLIRQARKSVLAVTVPEKVEQFIIDLVNATRKSSTIPTDYREYFESGAGQRATIALDLAARAQAWLQNRDFVTIKDVETMAPEVLRHRIRLDSTIAGTSLSVDDLIERLIQQIQKNNKP